MSWSPQRPPRTEALRKQGAAAGQAVRLSDPGPHPPGARLPGTHFSQGRPSPPQTRAIAHGLSPAGPPPQGHPWPSLSLRALPTPLDSRGDSSPACFLVWAPSLPPTRARALDSHLFFPEKFLLPGFGGGGWPAEPEWKISEANGAAMREPEPRARPWGGSARRGQADT